MRKEQGPSSKPAAEIIVRVGSAVGRDNSEPWLIDRDKSAFVNQKTGETRAELLVQIAGAHPCRVLFGKGKTGWECYSDDSERSYQGIACVSCPRVSEVMVFNKFYEENPDAQRPEYIGDCCLRYMVGWKREFVKTADGMACVEHDHPIVLSCPKSSIYAMFGHTAYMPKLQHMGLSIDAVVTRIVIRQKTDERSKATVFYADFEAAGQVSEFLTQATKTVAGTFGEVSPVQAVASAPAAAPATLAPKVTEETPDIASPS